MTQVSVECLTAPDLSLADCRALTALHIDAFPPADDTEADLEKRAKKLYEKWTRFDGPGREAARFFIVREGDRIIANAGVMGRHIHTTAGPMLALGLMGVSTATDRRGLRLGRYVVEAAFDVVDRGEFEHCFFQTSHAVRPFYEKLGAVRIHNTFFNSKGDDPRANPFWNEIAMRYPASRTDWPEGEIDLLGPGF